jgi:hypothetical protein
VVAGLIDRGGMAPGKKSDDGNAWVHDAGAKITAQVSTRKDLSASFPPAPSGAIPTVVFDDEHRLQHNYCPPPSAQ